jgi:hypothetical protein
MQVHGTWATRQIVQEIVPEQKTGRPTDGLFH